MAGNCISLDPGFRAKAGTAATTFHTWVETLPGGLSMSPASGSGAVPPSPFVLTASSPSGYGFLAEVQAILGADQTGMNSCYIRYNQSSHLLYLFDDSTKTWVGGLVAGVAGTAGNPQCSIDAGRSSVSGSGNQLTVNLAVTFQPAYAGTQNEYLIAWDNAGLNSGWQPMGTWTVPAPTTTVITSPPGLQLTVDGTNCTAPCVFKWAPGGSHTLSAATQSGGTGVQYVFATQTVTAPATSTTITADFTTQYLLTALANPAPVMSNPTQYWFVEKLAWHETGMSQFCESGRMESQYCSPGNDHMGWPVLGPPAGYGLLQRDPLPKTQPDLPEQIMWNWQTAVSSGKDEIDAAAGPASYSGNIATPAPGLQGYPFWIRQVRQWNAYNLDPTNTRVWPPSDINYNDITGYQTGPNGPLPNNPIAGYTPACTFRLAVDNNGVGSQQPIPVPAFVPSNQEPHFTVWFGDAILIKRFNEHPSTTLPGKLILTRFRREQKPHGRSRQEIPSAPIQSRKPVRASVEMALRGNVYRR